MRAAPGAALRVYRVAPVDRLVAAERELGAELFKLSGGDEATRRFRIHPHSGHLRFADDAALWSGEGGFPVGDRDIEQQARAFLEGAAKTARGCVPGTPALFPADLRRAWVGTVESKGGAADHALCQFAPYLYAGTDRAARVEGACVEVRLGARGRVIGLSSRWRPLAGEILSSAEEGAGQAQTAPGANAIAPAGLPQRPAIALPRLPQLPAGPAQHGHHHQAADGDEPVPDYVYWLEDEDAPQAFLAPRLLALEGHHGSVLPGSSHSLVVDILQRTSGELLEFRAEVLGGSGAFDYTWAAWGFAAPFGDAGNGGLRMLGTGIEVTAERAECCVLLGVRDRITGALCQVERMVYPQPLEEATWTG